MKLTADQQLRLDIISKYLSGKIHYCDAAGALQVKERQFRRLVKAFREHGITSLLHGNKNSSPKNKTSNQIRNEIIKLYSGRFKGLNIAHFREKLFDEEGVKKVPCYSTIRNILFEEKLVSAQMKRTKKAHPMRKRYEREGLMIQIDGSHHHWIMGRPPCCLTLAIDDATGKLVAGKFTNTETTFAAMEVVSQIIKKKGIFQMLYSDKAGIYGGGKRDGYSNMNSAMEDLGILPIQANTPQAKGRVERVFRTLQSRLIAEMRLEGVSSLEEANIFLENYLEEFNAKFGVKAANEVDAYKPMPFNLILTEIMCMRERRVVASGEVVSYNGEKFIVKNTDNWSNQKQSVEIRNYINGQMKMFIKGEEVEYEYFGSKKEAA
jgi:hypothetical protein